MTTRMVQDLTGRMERATGIGSGPRQAERMPGMERPGVERPSFSDLVDDFTRDVNALQFQAGHAIDMLATGQAADVHQVMIAVREASIALDLMLEIRNRVLEGYQELIRMQV